MKIIHPIRFPSLQAKRIEKQEKIATMCQDCISPWISFVLNHRIVLQGSPLSRIFPSFPRRTPDYTRPSCFGRVVYPWNEAARVPNGEMIILIKLELTVIYEVGAPSRRKTEDFPFNFVLILYIRGLIPTPGVLMGK